METATVDEPMTPTQFAAAAGVCEATCRRWIHAGRIRAQRLRGMLMIPASELSKVMTPQPVTPKAAG